MMTISSAVLGRWVLVLILVRFRYVASFEQPYYSQGLGGYFSDQEGGYREDWSVDWDQGGLGQQKCIDIPQNMTLCKNIGYTQMRLPNLLDHDTVREVTQQASSWVPLLGIRCHPDTKLFLCSLFSPVCLDHPIWPCRTLCEAVKNGCEALMLKYGFPWPEMLRCDKFPLDNDLCIGLQHDNKPDDTVCEACSQPDTFEAIIDNYCSADFVYRIEIAEHVVSGNDLKIVTARKKKKIKKGDISKRDLRNMVLYVGSGATCDCRQLTEVPPAGRNGGKKAKRTYLAMGNRSGDKLMLQYLITNSKANKDLRRAWKAMRKGDICENGLRKLHQNGQGKRGAKARRPSSIGGGSDVAPSDGQQPSRGSHDRKANDDSLKRRKKCKNPKKCVSTTKPEQSRRRGRERNDRRKYRRPRQ